MSNDRGIAQEQDIYMATYTAVVGPDSFGGDNDNDIIYIADGVLALGDFFAAASGFDEIILTSTPASVNFRPAGFSGIERVTGTAGDDFLRMGASQYSSFNTIDLGGGNDTLNIDISNGESLPNRTLNGIETVLLTVSANWSPNFSMLDMFLRFGVITNVDWVKGGFSYRATAATFFPISISRRPTPAICAAILPSKPNIHPRARAFMNS